VVNGASSRSARTSRSVRALVAPNSPMVLRDVALVVVRGILAWIFIYYGPANSSGRSTVRDPSDVHLLFDRRTLASGGLFAVLVVSLNSVAAS